MAPADDVSEKDKATKANATAAIQLQAEAHWKRAFPQTKVHWHQTSHFLLAGALDEAVLRDYGERAESLWTQWLRFADMRPSVESAAPGVGSVREPLVVFVVERPYALNEFALMVEDRWLPRPLDSSFWKSEEAFAYLVVLMRAEETLASSPLARAMAGASLAQRKHFPFWFERGMADAFSARATPDHLRVAKLQSKQSALTQLMTKPTDFLKGAVPLETADAAACSFVQYLQRERASFQKLLRVDAETADGWEKQLEEIYHQPLEQLVDRWWQQLGQSKRRRPPR